MRNLKLMKQSNIHNDNLKSCQLFCSDPDKSLIYFLSSKMDVWKVDANGDCSLLVNLGFVSDTSDCPVKFDYIITEEFLCLGRSNGEIIKYDFCQVETVDYVEAGIEAMSWSPDQELLVIITSDYKLLLKTPDFFTLQITDIISEHFGESQPVNVGWGKKETQFHGSIGKAAAHEKPQNFEATSNFDDRKVRISWREDGQYFVISYITPVGGYRQLRVCSREGIIQYTSEYVRGLEQAIFWQPSGSLIASSIRKPNKHVVAFFEKNCLQHGEFTLPCSMDKIKVNEIMWNTDSTILAVWLEDLRVEEELSNNRINHVQIWTVNNYNWYCKQNLNFGARGLTICQVCWNLTVANQLDVLCLDGNYLSYTWQWATACSTGPLEKHNGVVAVIDGNQLKVTSFRHSVVPPPLCAFSCNFELPVNCVVFGPESRCNEFLVNLDSDIIMHFSVDDLNTGSSDNKYIKVENGVSTAGKYTWTGNIEFNLQKTFNTDVPLAFLHWTWSCSDEILFTYTLDRKSMLCIAKINWGANESVHLAEIESFPLEGEVVHMRSSPSEKCTAIQLLDGSFFKFDHCERAVYPWYTMAQKQLKMRHPCSDLLLLSIDSQEHILAYTGTGLYFNFLELAPYCTSVGVSGDFVLYTTSDHLLYCVLKTSLCQGNICTMTEKLRHVERGSRIVTSTMDSKLVLQMPRGNLETIYPRPLVLHVIRNLLQKLNYKEAIVLMRRHRIDMNLFVDNDFNAFLRNVGTFVEQIDDVNLFNLFLSYLNEEDVTCTLYSNNLDTNFKNILPQESRKTKNVDVICDALRNELEKRDSNKYFLSILTCYIKMKNPQLEVALQRIKSLPHVIEQDSALDYLHRLVDVNELFNIALGTYDFQLVIMVAQKTQKDPKDYLPFLNEVKQLEPNYGKFTIDKHLKRYVKALQHIIACGENHFSECMSFIESHHLYSEALKLMPKSNSGYQVLLETYGNYLMKRNLHEEAGILFLKGKLHEQALDAFKLCCNWKKAFCVAHQLNYSSEALSELGMQLSDFLLNDRKYVDAAHILEIYCQNLEKSINVLLQGHEWELAALMIFRFQLSHMIDSHLRPALTEHSTNVFSTIQQQFSTFERYRKRLQQVRDQKRERQMGHYDDDNSSVDQFSETNSSRSTYSGVTGSAFTGRTARNKRKQEKKRVSLKEGSPFEEVAILELLTQIITQINDLKEDCNSLIKALSQFDFDEEAARLQTEIEQSFKSMLICKHEIWPSEENSSEETLTLGPMATSNLLAAQSMKRLSARPPPPEYSIYMQPPVLREVTWKLNYLIPSKNNL